MTDKFTGILPLVLAHEGGYVNHPDDPGGATNKGVTKAVYDAYRRNRGLPIRSVRNITRAELLDIYRRQYFEPVRGDELPAGLDYACFDYAVNSGPGRAIKDLQRTVGVPADGILGQISLAAIYAAANADEVKLIADYCNRRMRFLRSLRTWGTFGRGWKRRVIGDQDGHQITGDAGVIDYATAMALGDLQFPVKKAELPAAIGAKEGEEAGKGAESDVAIGKTKSGIGAVIAAAGVTGQTVITAAQQVQEHISESLFGRVALAVFLLMMLVGAGLLAYTFYQRLKEKGAI